MPFNPAALKAIDLADNQLCQQYTNYLRDIVRFNTVDELLLVRRFFSDWFKIHEDFRIKFPDRAAALDKLIIAGKWESLIGLQLDEIVDLFTNHLAALFTIADVTGWDDEEHKTAQDILQQGLRTAINGLANAVERDAFKKRLIQALEQNHESITTGKFYYGFKEVPPTTALWLETYRDFSGTKHHRFSISRFITKNENVLNLNEHERKAIKLLLECYERLFVSSSSVLGLEAQIPLRDVNNPYGLGGVIDYGEEHRYTKQQFERFRTSMKNYLTLLQESNKEVPDYIRDIIYGPQPRPGITPVSKTDLRQQLSLTTGPDIAATTGPDHFTEQDEAEIKQHGAIVTNTAKVNYDQVIADLKQELALSFTTPDQDKRFSELMTSVLRGLRDTMELKQYLVDLALPSADIAAIITAVQQQLTPRKRRSTSGPAPKLAGKPTLAQITKPIKEEPSDVGTGLDLSLQSTSNVTAQTQPKKTFLPKLKRSRAQHRPMVDDVKLQPSMVMGPIDELRSLDTLEFRRLSADPAQAAARVHDRITLLAEESIAKEAEGINAFKLSPLNTLYLELGNESIASGKTVTDLITERETNGIPTLSVAEFNAIADLNKQLRF